MVREEEDIILITDDGTVIRTGVSSIRNCGRASQGVRLMRVAEGSRIVGVTRTPKEEMPSDSEMMEETTQEAPTEEE